MQKTILFTILSICLVGVVLTSTSFGAFSAEISRSSSINVTSDTESVIQLTPNSNYDMVSLDSNGELSIEPANLNADSVNRNMYLTLGDRNNLQNDNAFTITSLADRPAIFTIKIQQSPEFSSPQDSVTYIIRKPDGTQSTITAGQSETIVVAPTDTLYVAVELNTNGVQSGNMNHTIVIESETQQ